MASNNRGIKLSRVVFPAPVLPMIAVVIPAPDRSEISDSTDSSAPGYLNDTSRNSTSPRPASVGRGAATSTTDDSMSSTSWMRSADTAARGAIIAIIVPIITAIRICVR